MLEPHVHEVCLLLLWNFCDECGLLQNVKKNFASSKQKFCCIFLTLNFLICSRRVTGEAEWAQC